MNRISYFLRCCLGVWPVGLCGVLMLAGCGGGSQGNSTAEIPSQNATALEARATVGEDALEERATNYALIEEASASGVPSTGDAALHAYEAKADRAAQ